RNGSTRRRQRSGARRQTHPAARRNAAPDERYRCRTRGTGAGSQIQRAGSTSSKSAYSEYFQASEYFEACVDPSLEPSLVLPEDCPDEDGAPAPLFFGRTLAGMPTALESAATSLTTTALAPTAELSPTTTGPRIFAPEPMSTCLPMVGCRWVCSMEVPPRVTWW